MNDNINIKGDYNKVNENSNFEKSQSRWKSKVLWSSLVADLLGLFGLLGFYDFTGIPQEKVSAICGAIMAIMTTLGVINNPSDKQNI